MAKYILKNHDNSFNSICEDLDSKNYWINNFENITSFEEMTDSDYISYIRGEKYFTEKAPLNTILIDSVSVDQDFSKEDIQSKLEATINKMSRVIRATENPPSIWTTNLNILQSININSLTFPISGKNWVDCLMKNGITNVPSTQEFRV